MQFEFETGLELRIQNTTIGIQNRQFHFNTMHDFMCKHKLNSSHPLWQSLYACVCI